MNWKSASKTAPCNWPLANESLQREITERQRAEESIRKINAELEQRVLDRTAELAAANQELEAFTYSVAHDLQAPLRNIQSYAQLLEEEWASKLPPETAHYLKRIASRSKNMAQLISGLLNLSVIGKQGLKLQRVELNGIVDDVVSCSRRKCPTAASSGNYSHFPRKSAIRN